MCTFEHDPKIKLPTEKTTTVYKVFGKTTSPPLDFDESTPFKFGRNTWNGEMAIKDDCYQSGFQVFVTWEDAKCWKEYVGEGHELICPITIETKDIVKMTNDFHFFRSGKLRVYEVSSFFLSEENWKGAGGR